MDRDQHQPSLATFGRRGGPVDLSGGDVTFGSGVKAIQVVAEGNLVYRPVDGNADITVKAAPVGFTPFHIPGVVRQAGTSATVVTIED